MRTPRRQDARNSHLLCVLAPRRWHFRTQCSHASDLLRHRADLLKEAVEFLSGGGDIAISWDCRRWRGIRRLLQERRHRAALIAAELADERGGFIGVGDLAKRA